MVRSNLRSAHRTIALISVFTFFVANAHAEPARPSAHKPAEHISAAPGAQLSQAERARIHYLLKQIGENIQTDSPINLLLDVEFMGVPKSKFQSARSAYAELIHMGPKIVPELLASLNEPQRPSFPTSEVESLLFELHGEPAVIASINAGKLNSKALETVEQMLHYTEYWARESLFSLFSSNNRSARAFAFTVLPKILSYEWEDLEVQGITQRLIDVLIQAANSDEDVRLKSLAIEALGECHHINENKQAETGVSLSILNSLDAQEKREGRAKADSHETTAQMELRVKNWRAKQKQICIAQNEQILKTFCDILEHGNVPSVRRSAANQLRQCQDAKAEPFILRGLRDTDASVREECILYILKQVVQNAQTDSIPDPNMGSSPSASPTISTTTNPTTAPAPKPEADPSTNASSALSASPVPDPSATTSAAPSASPVPDPSATTSVAPSANAAAAAPSASKSAGPTTSPRADQ